MRLNFFSIALPAIAEAMKLPGGREAFADYLMSQVEKGELSDLEIIELAQAYDNEHVGSFGDYTAFNQIDSDVLDKIFAQDDGEPLSVAETEAVPSEDKPSDDAKKDDLQGLDKIAQGKKGGVADMVSSGANRLYDLASGAGNLALGAASFGLTGIAKAGVPIYNALAKLSPKGIKAL